MMETSRNMRYFDGKICEKKIISHKEDEGERGLGSFLHTLLI